jgi:hypothetical protein
MYILLSISAFIPKLWSVPPPAILAAHNALPFALYFAVNTSSILEIIFVNSIPEYAPPALYNRIVCV